MVHGDVTVVTLPSGGDFLKACAGHVLAAAPDPAELSRAGLILPNLLLASDLRAAFHAAAGGAVLLPRLQTLPAVLEPWLAAQPHLPDSRRLFALYHALKARRWLDEASLWDVCAELVALFDELTLAGVGLPATEAELQMRLAHAYARAVDEPLRFEARLVHVLWQADNRGVPSRAAARLLAARAWAAARTAPLFAIAEGALSPFERDVYAACAERVPVTVFVPDRWRATDGLARVLNAAWPAGADAPPLALRAAGLADTGLPLGGRVRLFAAHSLEQEARAVAATVRGWLASGKRRIALVAADRVAARRTRALLERDGVLVEDETGWKLSTTRAAALVDAWLSVLSSDGYHRDVLDLLKSPFVAGSTGEADRAAGIEAVARLYAHHGLASGLDAVALLAAGDAPAAALVRLLLEARSVFPRTAATPAQWLDRLGAALAALGAVTALASDAAGADILAWIAARRAELADEDARIGFHEWRQWLDRELESVMFRDRSVDSPVVMTHLAAARLRRFEAAALIGADADNLAPQDRRPVFAHEGVRAELGLPGSAQARARLHDDLAGLLTLADAVCISWQHLRDGEAVLPCAAVDVLSLVHQQAFGESLRAPVPRSFEADVPVVGQPVPAPVLMPEQVPTRISASGLASLIACPYRYFARHVLGLGEAEEVSEALEKADYGQMIHAILQAFHARFPQIAAEDDAVLVAALEDESARVFGPALARNFLEHAWAARWRAQLPSYVAWQKAREAEGWTFAAAEESAWRDFALADGARVTLHGRLDRIDRRRDGTEAVLDYKSRPLGALRKQAADADDVQLAVYTLLRGTAVREAAYVALDDGAVGAAPLDDPVAMAEVQAERLVTAFDALHAGAPLPAHGVACTHCEMRGLCRKDYQA